MSLTSEINELKEQMGREIPVEILRKIGLELSKLGEGSIMENSCKAGDKAPSFVLPDVSGREVSSADMLADNHMVLSFYRGVW